MNLKKFDQINVIPFIDIMLVLLAIVLMTASFIAQGKIKVTLPDAETATTVTQNDVARRIIITASGDYYFDDKKINLPALDRLMKTWDNATPITLKIDARAEFDHFVALSDLLRRHQLTNIQVLTQKKPDA